jgi:hypothetical protein
MRPIRDQGAVAQTYGRRHVDAVEQLAGLGRLQHRRLALFHDVLRAAHGCGRVDRHDLPRHQPVEQMADGGQALLDRGCRLRVPVKRDHGFRRKVIIQSGGR